MTMDKLTIEAAGFEELDSFNGLTLYCREASGTTTLLVFDGAEARYVNFGAATTYRDVLRDESEARMLRVVAGGMGEGPGKPALLAQADAVAPLGALWSGT